MNSLELDPKKTALVIIDLQQGIVARAAAPHSSAKVMERSSQLAKAFRVKGGIVVYVRVNMSDALRLLRRLRLARFRLRRQLPSLRPRPAFNRAICLSRNGIGERSQEQISRNNLKNVELTP